MAYSQSAGVGGDTAWLLAGIGIGVGIGIGAVLLWKRQRAATAGSPELTVHDVHRDDQGRIVSVETVQGIGGNSGVQQAMVPDAA